VSERSYNQICGLAQALDLLGERWTLLVLRELMLGPKRFSSLRAALPGINANLLAARLRKLATAGVIERVALAAPAEGVQAYALTERGEALREPMTSLALWGFDLIEPESQVAAGWTARGSWLAMSKMAAAERRGDLDGLQPTTVNVEVGDETFVLTTDGRGGGSVRHGTAGTPDAELSFELKRLHELLSGAAPLDDSLGARAKPLLAALAS
jgi:DNA-binding HxlR family transcriptional regulator